MLRFSSLLMLGAFVSLGACASGSLDSNSAASRSPSGLAGAELKELDQAVESFVSGRNNDEGHRSLATHLPHLSGVYLDVNGVGHTNLKAGADAAERRLALAVATEVSRRLAAPFTRVRTANPTIGQVHEVDFSFVELASFRERSFELFDSGLIHLVDVDERSGQLVLVAASESDRQSVMVELGRLRIPLAAVRAIVEPRAEPLVTLRDWVRPVRGGMQITSSANKVCTLGYNALHLGRNEEGFLTNSHCTSVNGGIDGVAFGQPDMGIFGLSRIGVEVLDPLWGATWGCPSNKQCRLSDAAFVKYDAASLSRRGLLARPQSWCFLPTTNCTLMLPSTIANDPVAEMRVTTVGGYPFPVLGELLDKVGRTTGWTVGAVTGTCQTIDMDGTRVLVCQDRVDAGSIAGDSGAPVFRWLGGSPINYVSPMGLLWGKLAGQDMYFFSWISQVEEELGSMTYLP